MTNVLAPTPVMRFYDNNGDPLVGGQVFTYQSNTTTKATTYKDSSNGSPNDNPIVLNARGECDLWIPPNVAFTLVIAPATDTDPPANPIDTINGVVSSQLITLYGGVDTGAVNAYVLTFSANFSSYTDGPVVYWVPAHTNTGPSTLNINGIGVANIVYPGGGALFGGELIAGQPVQVVVSSGQFILLSAAYQSGSFPPAWSGFSVAPTGTMFWQKIGAQVTITWVGNQGTSNSTSMSIGNVPSQIRPGASVGTLLMPVFVIDNGVTKLGSWDFGGTSTFTFSVGTAPPSPTGFTNPGTKGLGNRWSLTYSLS